MLPVLFTCLLNAFLSQGKLVMIIQSTRSYGVFKQRDISLLKYSRSRQVSNTDVVLWALFIQCLSTSCRYIRTYAGQHYGNYHDYGSYFYHGYNGSYAQNVYGNWSNHYGNSSDYYNNYSDGVTPHPFHFEPCGGQVSEFAGLIKTPGYPTENYPSSTYPPYKDCWWYRDGDEKTLVQASVQITCREKENIISFNCFSQFL